VSAVEEHATLERVAEQPKLDLGKALKADPRGMLVRFAAGMLTSIVAGTLTLAFGPRVGGIMLAFPAILVASLTLIYRQEDAHEAREDARGAIAGGVALTVFAVVFTLLIGHTSGPLTLLIAAAAWVVVALGLYGALWWQR
jgi:ABC-type bacteriocin/lantibiotic exporter with double-glycine peptidase domain